MAEHSNDLHAAAQMLDCILEAAKNFAAKPIAGDPNDEQVIRTFIKDELDRDTRIRASENRSERTLPRASILALHHPEILQINIDNALCGAAIVQSVEQGCESLVSCFETPLRCIRIRWPRPRILCAIAISDLDDLHMCTLPLVGAQEDRARNVNLKRS